MTRFKYNISQNLVHDFQSSKLGRAHVRPCKHMIVQPGALRRSFAKNRSIDTLTRSYRRTWTTILIVPGNLHSPSWRSTLPEYIANTDIYNLSGLDAALYSWTILSLGQRPSQASAGETLGNADPRRLREYGIPGSSTSLI